MFLIKTSHDFFSSIQNTSICETGFESQENVSQSLKEYQF